MTLPQRFTEKYVVDAQGPDLAAPPMTVLYVEVVGLPAGQGSKRHVGGGRMIEQSKNVAPWRQDVTAAALAAMGEDRRFFPLTAPVAVTVIFWFPRPKAHYRTGGSAHLLRDDAPTWHARTPDVEKAVRATHDALTIAGVWRDDAQVAQVTAIKRYATDRGTDCASPGASIRVEALP